MIEFYFESDFEMANTRAFSTWINRIITSENYQVGQITYIFCDDIYLLGLNQRYLNHDTFTDIITFDYREGKNLSGDIFISTERVEENAQIYKVTFHHELLRVMSHGLLHLMGYKDKSEAQRLEMRKKEDEKIKLFHVEQ